MSQTGRDRIRICLKYVLDKSAKWSLA